MTKYSDKLKSPKWQKKRLEILNRDNWTCLGCGDKETQLHVHHVKYTKEPYDAPNEDLQTLCKHCHMVIEIFKSHVWFDGNIKIFKSDTFLCAVVKKGTILFPMADGNIQSLHCVFFESNSTVLKQIYDANNSMNE